jgi:hypothetical protein
LHVSNIKDIQILNLFRISIFDFRVYGLYEYAGNGIAFSILTGIAGGIISI